MTFSTPKIVIFVPQSFCCFTVFQQTDPDYLRTTFSKRQEPQKWGFFFELLTSKTGFSGYF